MKEGEMGGKEKKKRKKEGDLMWSMVTLVQR